MNAAEHAARAEALLVEADEQLDSFGRGESQHGIDIAMALTAAACVHARLARALSNGNA